MMAANLIFSLLLHLPLQVRSLVATTKLAEMVPSFGGRSPSTWWTAPSIALFLLFIWASLWADIRRVYQYHGAEHKTVFN
jgi:uncharacterized protein YqhQ